MDLFFELDKQRLVGQAGNRIALQHLQCRRSMSRSLMRHRKQSGCVEYWVNSEKCSKSMSMRISSFRNSILQAARPNGIPFTTLHLKIMRTFSNSCRENTVFFQLMLNAELTSGCRTIRKDFQRTRTVLNSTTYLIVAYLFLKHYPENSRRVSSPLSKYCRL